MIAFDKSRRRSLGALALISSALAGPSAATETAGTVAEEALVLDRFLDAYRALDIPAMFGLLAEDIYFEDPTFHLLARNREEMRPIIEPAAAMLKGVTIEPFNRIHASPWMVSQQRLKATLTRPDGGLRQIDVQGLSMFEIRRGKIVRWYDYYDVLTFRRQTAASAA